jgi:hypothetical protein
MNRRRKEKKKRCTKKNIPSELAELSLGRKVKASGFKRARIVFCCFQLVRFTLYYLVGEFFSTLN